MKTRYLIAIVIAGIIIVVMSAIRFFDRPGAGDAAPQFVLQDIQGVNHSFADYNGKTVFLHFWATWCGKCLQEIPEMEKLYGEYRDSDIVILSVLVDDDGSNLPAIKSRQPLDYTVLVDPQGEAADLYKVWGVPESFIIDRNGLIVLRSISAVKYGYIKARLEELR